MMVHRTIGHAKPNSFTGLRRILALVTAVTASAIATAVAGAHPAGTICGTVAPTQAALQKALGVAIHAPVSVTGTPMHCDVSGYHNGARIYLYPKNMAKTVTSQLTQAFGGHNPTKQALAGLGSGATLEFIPGASFVYFTSGSHFVLISGSTTTNPQLVAVSHAVYTKLG